MEAVAGADAAREEAEAALRRAAREHAEASDEAERASGCSSAGARAPRKDRTAFAAPV